MTHHVQSNIAGANDDPAIFAFTSHNPTPMTDHACGPVAHAVLATVVVLAGPSKSCQPPYAMPWSTASEQAGSCRPPVVAVQSMGDLEMVAWGVCAVISIILLVW